MLLPNISSLFKWVNPFYPGVKKNGSEDFLQLVRASDGTILETGRARVSLALAAGGGVRVLKGPSGQTTSLTAHLLGLT